MSMLREITHEALRGETLRLCRIMGGGRPAPEVSVHLSEERLHTTGRANGRRVHLTVPRTASVAQALALVVHEVAHWLEPRDHEHGQDWRTALARCSAAYEAPLPLEVLRDGTKQDVHTALRQALADRLRDRQHAAPDDEDDAPEVLDNEVLGRKREQVLRRVAKLLALADRAGSEHEAAAAATKAARLLRVYRLSMGDVEAAEATEADPMTDCWVACGTRKRVAWKTDLGFGLARALGVYALSYRWCPRNVSTKRSCAMRFFGRASAVRVCEYLMGYLLREVDRLAQEAVRSGDHRDRAEARHYGRSFRGGCVSAVLRRLRSREEEEAAERAASEALGVDCRSLVVVLKQDHKAAEDWARSGCGVKATGTTTFSRHYGDGFGDGLRAGKSIDLSRPVAGGGNLKELTHG